MKFLKNEKIKYVLVFFLSLFVLFLFPEEALCAQKGEMSEEKYEEALNSFDLSFFEKELDDETYSFLDELEITDFDFDSVSSLSFEKIINIILDMLSKRIKAPVKALAGILIYIVLSSLFQSLKSDSSDMGDTYSTVSAVLVSLALVASAGSCIQNAVSRVRIASDFIFAFVPVFCAITAACGQTATSFSTNTMLLLLAQGLSLAASNLFTPLINCFLCLGMCCGIRAELNLQRLVSSLKKIITTLISFVSGLFVSVLSIKTTVATRADDLGLRSARFAVNSVVPVVGGALSEGLASIQGYSSLIKSSVGAVGICAAAFVFLPSIIETALWRAVLSLGLIICNVFGEKSVCLVLEAFKDTFLLLNVVLIVSGLTTVISLGVIVAAGK